MENKDQSKLQQIRDMLTLAKDWVLEHSKVVMPIILLICIGVTVLIAVNANKKDKLEKEAEKAAIVMATTEPEAINPIITPEFELELNAYPEINNLVRNYYDAQASGDVETISKMNTYLNDIEKIRIQELSNYIEGYPEIDIYTKPGLTENSYIAYVCSKVKFYDLETPMPGMQTYYIEADQDGNFSINDGTYDERIFDHIKEVTLQDDVVDLNNKVVVEYNDLLASDEELNEFIAYLKEKINEEVGEILAESEAPTTPPEENATDENQTDSQEAQTVTVVSKVRVTEKVNIRKSDSKDSDKVGAASANEEFNLVEKKGNGWTEIEYNGGTAFINSDYLEDVETVTVKLGDEEENNAEVPSAPASSATKVSGKVTLKEGGVRIRKEPNTDCDVLATGYKGDKYDFIEKTGEWSKIKYKNDYGYIKTEFLEFD